MHAGAQSNPAAVRQASLLRVSNAGILKGCLGGMEAKFAGGVCLLLVAIGTSACNGVISPPPVPKIYVADASNNRIVRMDDMTGAGWTPFGTSGSGMNQSNGPFGIFVSAGQLYVADRNNNRIVRMDSMTGAGWTEFGTLCNGPDQLSCASGIVPLPGHVFVG